MKIIALVGKMGSGKDTFALMAEKHLPSKTRIVVGPFSNTLVDILKTEGKEPTRKNLKQLGEKINPETLFDEQRRKINESQVDIFFITGIRRLEDVDFLRSLDGILIAVHVNDSATRYQRIRSRQQKPGEKETSWEEFLQQESHPIESKIDDIMRMADYRVDNNGTPEEFEKQIAALLEELYPH